MIIVSLIVSAVTGRLEETINAVFEGAASAVSVLISFAGAMCFWTGIMKIAEKCGISRVISKAIAPLVKWLFPGASEKSRHYISMNMAANFLGMGNAATPMGMMAAEELDNENINPEKPSVNMCMLVVLNTTSFQLIPTTILALRSAAGSQNALSVIVPMWIASIVAVAVGVISVKIMGCFAEKTGSVKIENGKKTLCGI